MGWMDAHAGICIHLHDMLTDCIILLDLAKYIQWSKADEMGCRMCFEKVVSGQSASWCVGIIYIACTSLFENYREYIMVTIYRD